MKAMRTLILSLLLFVAVGCADDTFAGSTGFAGAGGDTGTGGTTGAGGTGGGAAGQGGASALPTSCNIPLEQISGTDTAASWHPCTGQQTIRAIVTDGSCDLFGPWPTVGSYTITPHSGGTVGNPTTDGQCNVDIRYDRPATCQGGETLYVHLVVPAI
jgi:hypothetical protein